MMMDDFFTVQSIEELSVNEGSPSIRPYKIVIRLNPDHPVYLGHFPGNPVTPGVCQIRMITELASGVLNQELFLKEADNIKFLTMILPEKNQDLIVEIKIRELNFHEWEIFAELSDLSNKFFKFKGLYTDHRPAVY